MSIVTSDLDALLAKTIKISSRNLRCGNYALLRMGYTDRFNVCPHLGVLKVNAGNFSQISAGLRDGGWGCLLEVVSDCGLEGL